MPDHLKNFIKKLNLETDDNFVSKLQEINGKFITEYKIEINYNNKKLTIIPIETEIYYYNEKQKDIFEDKMIHKNEDLQKNNFGRLYFHRIQSENKQYVNMKWGKKKKDPIDLKSCGVDVCLSDSEDYYLSILIRSAFINGTKEKDMFSGINKICRKIINIFEPEECVELFFKNLEDIDNIIQERKDEINTDNIFYHRRISGKSHSKKNIEELNCLNLGKYLDKKDSKDEYEYLNYIINTKQTFYNVPDNIKRIKKDFEEQRKTMK